MSRSRIAAIVLCWMTFAPLSRVSAETRTAAASPASALPPGLDAYVGRGHEGLRGARPRGHGGEGRRRCCSPRATASGSWARRPRSTRKRSSASPRTPRSSPRSPSACSSRRASSSGTPRSSATCPPSRCGTPGSPARSPCATCSCTEAAWAWAPATCSGGRPRPTTARRSAGGCASCGPPPASAAPTPTTTCSTWWPARSSRP